MFAFATAALSLAACARFHPRPLNPARSAAQLSARRLEARTWTLGALEEEAVRRHPEVVVARAQYDSARAAIGSAGERPNPSVALSPQVVTPFKTWSAGTYGVDFDWTFETAGKRARRVDVARAQVNVAAANVIAAEWKARGAVRSAFLDLYAADKRAALIADANAKQTDVLKSIEGRIKAGAAALLETSQPRLLAAQLRLQAADAAKSQALARTGLGEALGLSREGVEGVKFSFAAFEKSSGERRSSRRAAMTHRAEVLAALADYGAAEASLRLEIAKQYPDVHLNPGYQFDAGENKWALGVGLNLPILSQNKGPIAEAEAKRKEAAAKFLAVQSKVLAECDRAATAVTAARAKLATADALIEEQGKQIESFTRIAAAGEGDRLAVLSAEVERATTRVSRLEAYVELQSALGALELATQTPLEP
jgi:outer membrane protein TolC